MINGPVETVKLARTLRSEMSLPELVLWRHLRMRPDGFKFRRQHPAGPYVLDFYCPAVRLAIEVDGAAHEGRNAAKYDQARSASLRSQHVATLRIPARAVLDDAEAVIGRIVTVCCERREGMADLQVRAPSRVPLHQPSAGPPPPAGEERA